MGNYAIVSRLPDLSSSTLAGNWSNTLPFCVINGVQYHIAMSGDNEVRIVGLSNYGFYYAYKNPWSGSGNYTIFLENGDTGTSSSFPTGSGTVVDGWITSSRLFNVSSYLIPTYSTAEDCKNALVSSATYPITYHYINSTVSGSPEAAVGDTVTVSAVPDVDYGITDPTTQIAVTNNDDPVNFTWDASTNRITFVMPDPT